MNKDNNLHEHEDIEVLDAEQFDNELSEDKLDFGMKLMEENDKLISEYMLDPDEEGLGFGDNAVQPWKNEKQNKNSGNLKKVVFIIIAVILIIGIIIGAVFGIVNIRKAKQEQPTPVNAEKFPIVFFDMSGNVNVKPHNDTGYTVLSFESAPSEQYGQFIKTNNDGSMLFFANQAVTDDTIPYDLYYRDSDYEGTPSNESSISNAKCIAKSVMGKFDVSNNGKYVVYLKEVANGKGKLYINDLKLETVIEEHDVTDFEISDDNKYILYYKNFGEAYDSLYIKSIGDNSEPQRIDNNVVKIVSHTSDLNRIYYLRQSDLAEEQGQEQEQNIVFDGDETDPSKMERTEVMCSLRLKVMGREPIDIVDGVVNVSDITERGNFVFAMENKTVLTYDDLVEDEYVETDKLIEKPDINDYKVISTVNVDENRDGRTESKEVITTDTESYNRALSKWNERAKRDETREILKSKNVEVVNTGLYCFVNGSVIEIAADCEQYYPVDIDNGVVAYTQREAVAVTKYGIDQLVDDTGLMFNQTGKGDSIRLYYGVYRDSNELSRKYDGQSILCQGGKLYYLDEYDETTGKGTLYSIDAQSRLIKLADDVNSFVVSKNSGQYAYVSNAADGYGELFGVNAKGERTLLSNKVEAVGGYAIDDEGNVAAIDSEKSMIIYWDTKQVQELAANPGKFIFREVGDLLFIADSAEGVNNTLFHFDGNTAAEIMGGVACFILPY